MIHGFWWRALLLSSSSHGHVISRNVLRSQAPLRWNTYLQPHKYSISATLVSLLSVVCCLWSVVCGSAALSPFFPFLRPSFLASLPHSLSHSLSHCHSFLPSSLPPSFHIPTFFFFFHLSPLALCNHPLQDIADQALINHPLSPSSQGKGRGKKILPVTIPESEHLPPITHFFYSFFFSGVSPYTLLSFSPKLSERRKSTLLCYLHPYSFPLPLSFEPSDHTEHTPVTKP